MAPAGCPSWSVRIPATEKANWLASLGAWLPTLSSFRSRGMACWLICSVPAGCRMKPESAGSSWRSTTSSLTFGGSAVFQLDIFCASAARIGMTAIGGSVVFGLSPQVKSMPMEIEKKKNDSDAVPCTCQGVGPESATSMPTPYTPIPNTCTENWLEISAIEMKRRELDERIEARTAGDRAGRESKEEIGMSCRTGRCSS